MLSEVLRQSWFVELQAGFREGSTCCSSQRGLLRGARTGVNQANGTKVPVKVRSALFSLAQEAKRSISN